MNYTDVTDKEYRGYDITIYEHSENDYTVDIKKPCGELVEGLLHQLSYETAFAWAINCIDDLVRLKEKKIKPVWVQILWSESGEFKDNELVYYPAFENRAYRVAMFNPVDNGYLKTKINVLFDNGDEYICRLDLASDDALGFEDHARKLIRWHERQQNDSSEQDLYADNYNFLKQINWGEI